MVVRPEPCERCSAAIWAACLLTRIDCALAVRQAEIFCKDRRLVPVGGRHNLSSAFVSVCCESIAATVLSAAAVVSFVLLVLAESCPSSSWWPSRDHAAAGLAAVE